MWGRVMRVFVRQPSGDRDEKSKTWNIDIVYSLESDLNMDNNDSKVNSVHECYIERKKKQIIILDNYDNIGIRIYYNIIIIILAFYFVNDL